MDGGSAVVPLCGTVASWGSAFPGANRVQARSYMQTVGGCCIVFGRRPRHAPTSDGCRNLY
jgi:hypothetical protein